MISRLRRPALVAGIAAAVLSWAVTPPPAPVPVPVPVVIDAHARHHHVGHRRDPQHPALANPRAGRAY